MAKELTLGFDVVAHFSQDAVERVVQSYYHEGVFPDYVSGSFGNGGAGHVVEVFFAAPRLRFIGVAGVENAVRLTFGYLVRLTNYDWEATGEASVTIGAVPLTVNGRQSLGIDLAGPGLGQFDFTSAGYPEFEPIVRPLIVASLVGPGRSILLIPPAEPRPENLQFRIYPGAAAGYLGVFVTAGTQPMSPPPAMPSFLSPSQDLAIALPVEVVDGLLAEGLVLIGLGDLPATMEFGGEERTVEEISFRLRDHYLEVTGRIDGVEFIAKALLHAGAGGYTALVQSVDVDLPWYLDVLDAIGGGVVQRAISAAFPALLGSIGSDASSGLGLFSGTVPGLQTLIAVQNKGYAEIGHQGMVAAATVTPMITAGPPRTPTYIKGNRKTREFHRPGCPYGEKLKSYERFVREAAAIRAGYNGCFTCAHEFSHPLGNLIFSFRSTGNQPNSLLTLEIEIEGKLVTPVVVDGVEVTDPPFTRTAKLTGKVKPDGSWERTLYDSSSLLVPGTWRLRATRTGWTGECTARIRPTARNFGSTNMIAFTVGKPTGNIGYGTMPPYP